MLLGIFGGHTAAAIRRSAERTKLTEEYFLQQIQETKVSHRERLDKAMADRQAVIAQAQNELFELQAIEGV